MKKILFSILFLVFSVSVSADKLFTNSDLVYTISSVSDFNRNVEQSDHMSAVLFCHSDTDRCTS